MLNMIYKRMWRILKIAMINGYDSNLFILINSIFLSLLL